MRSIAARVVPVVLAMGVFIAMWQLYVEIADPSPLLVPAPRAVWDALVHVASTDDTWRHARITGYEILAGFALALSVGLVVGILAGEFRWFDEATRPIIVALQVVPKVALLPLFIVWFGFGPTSKVLVSAVFAFFPIATATAAAGLHGVDPSLRDLARGLRMSRPTRLRLVVLPAALPSVLVGCELGIVLATVGAVVAEYVSGSEGLGYLAVVVLNRLRVAELFAIVVLLSVMGSVLAAATTALRRLLVPWHPSATTPSRGRT